MPVTFVHLSLSLFALLCLASPFAAAAEPIGASGQCYNEDASKGNQDRVELDADEPTQATLPSGTGAAEAVALYVVSSSPQSIDGCKRYDCGTWSGAPACEPGQEARVDYMEAHAAGAQVCYARGNVWTDGRCPTAPTGP